MVGAILGVEGEVEVEATFNPRFDYARASMDVQLDGPGLMALGSDGSRMAASLGLDNVQWEKAPGGGMRARFVLRAGQRCWMILSWR